MEEELTVVYETGDIQEPVTPTSKRRKSDIIANLDLGSRKNRRPWMESRTFGRYSNC